MPPRHLHFPMQFTNLAAHPDIGSNSYLLELGATRLVLDAGTHPKHTGRDTLPLYEDLPRDSLDGILVSHPHLDHIGALPVLMHEQPGAAVVMTGLTREHGDVLLHNSVNVMKAQREELNEPLYPLYSHGQVESCVKRWIVREPGHAFSLGDRDRVSIEFFRAGHVLGAVGMRIEAEGRRVFYTGDVHFEDQTITKGAVFPTDPVDALIVETTRGDHQRDPGQGAKSPDHQGQRPPAPRFGDADGRRERSFGRLDARDDHADVVRTAPFIGQLDQAIGRLVERGHRQQHVLNLGIADVGGEAIGAEQEDIPFTENAVEEVGLRLLRGAQGTRDDVALGMCARLFGGQHACAHLLLNP